MYYRNIPTLREYIIVAQNEPFVTVYRRLPDGAWTITDVKGMDGVLTLSAIGCTLTLRDI